MMGPKCEREGIGQNVLRHRRQTDTTPFTIYWGCCAGCTLYPRITVHIVHTLQKEQRAQVTPLRAKGEVNSFEIWGGLKRAVLGSDLQNVALYL
jgi:hypothetical protein